MMTYQVSASIVVYKNDPEEVAAAVKSILSTSLRVICTVIDNSPTQALRPYVTDSGAEYVHVGRNVGYGSGHNVALRKDVARSEYHLVLNPDVSFAPQSPLLLYQFMNDRPDVGLVMPRILYPDGTDQRLCKKLPTPLDLMNRRFLGGVGRSLFSKQLRTYEMLDVDLGVAREVPCLSGCFMFIRCAALHEVGYFDERYFMYMEDVDLCRRIGERYKTVFFPRVSITHGYAKGSYRNFRLLRYHLQSAIKYFIKWGWFRDSKRVSLNSRIDPLVKDHAANHPISAEKDNLAQTCHN
jgi:GT2 family glycosyltransferase